MPITYLDSLKDSFELTPKLKEQLEKFGYLNDIEAEAEGTQAKLKPEVVKDLKETYNLFTSEKHADEYIDSAKKAANYYTEKIIKEVAGKEAKDFEVSIAFEYKTKYLVYEGGALYITLKYKDSEETLEPSSLYYAGAQEAMYDSFSSYNWLFWLASENSPFGDDDFRGAYEYDETGQALQHFAQTLNESDYKWELEKTVKKLLSREAEGMNIDEQSLAQQEDKFKKADKLHEQVMELLQKGDEDSVKKAKELQKECDELMKELYEFKTLSQKEEPKKEEPKKEEFVSLDEIKMRARQLIQKDPDMLQKVAEKKAKEEYRQEGKKINPVIDLVTGANIDVEKVYGLGLLKKEIDKQREEVKQNPDNYMVDEEDTVPMFLDVIVEDHQGIHQPDSIATFFGPENLGYKKVEEGENKGKWFSIEEPEKFFSEISEDEFAWEAIDAYASEFAEALNDKLGLKDVTLYFGHGEGSPDYGLIALYDAEQFKPTEANSRFQQIMRHIPSENSLLGNVSRIFSDRDVDAIANAFGRNKKHIEVERELKSRLSDSVFAKLVEVLSFHANIAERYENKSLQAFADTFLNKSVLFETSNEIIYAKKPLSPVYIDTPVLCSVLSKGAVTKVEKTVAWFLDNAATLIPKFLDKDYYLDNPVKKEQFTKTVAKVLTEETLLKKKYESKPSVKAEFKTKWAEADKLSLELYDKYKNTYDLSETNLDTLTSYAMELKDPQGEALFNALTYCDTVISQYGLTELDIEQLLKDEEPSKEELEKDLKKKDEIVGTGEPDQDYDHKFYDAICKEISKAGFKCEHEEFDKYQGVYLTVSKGDRWVKVWTVDGWVTGKPLPSKEPYRRAVLVDHEGGEYSATPGDYWNLPKDHVFKNHSLVLVKHDGTKEEIENPKVSDLKESDPYIKYEGEPSDVLLMVIEGPYPASSGKDTEHKEEYEVVVDPNFKVDASALKQGLKKVFSTKGDTDSKEESEPEVKLVDLDAVKKEMDSDLAEAAKEVDAAMAPSTLKKYQHLLKKPVMDEQEILSIKKHYNAINRGGSWGVDYPEEFKTMINDFVKQFDSGKEIGISQAQSQKGINWLRNNILDKKGNLRKSALVRESDIGEDEAHIIKNFKKFTWVGFNTDSDQNWQSPIYRTYDKDGNYFDYSVSATYKMQILDTQIVKPFEKPTELFKDKDEEPERMAAQVEAKDKELEGILIALNSGGGFIAEKYPIGNKELTEKAKKLEEAGKIAYDKFNNKWKKAKAGVEDNKMLEMFLKKKTIEDCLKHYPTENGLKEIIIGDISFLYGNKGLIGYTPTHVFEWDINDYGNGPRFQLFDMQKDTEGEALDYKAIKAAIKPLFGNDLETYKKVKAELKISG